jgi:hypothetical protein
MGRDVDISQQSRYSFGNNASLFDLAVGFGHKRTSVNAAVSRCEREDRIPLF